MGLLQIYNASAGSGKTYSLVREYLKVLLCSDRPDGYRGILAVTFTNKAAWEMKSRILWVLEDLSRGEDAGGMREYLEREVEITGQVLQERARQTLESLYNDYSAFSVSTIDSFTTRLVRSFSRELHLPVGFNIVVDGDEILGQAVDMLLLRAGGDEKLSDMLLDFVLHNVDQGSGWDISSVLFSGGKMMQDENGSEALERLGEKKAEDFLELRRRLAGYMASVEKEVADYGKKACGIIYEDLGSDKILAGGANGIASFFRKAAQGRVTDLDPESSAVEKFLGGKYASATATAEQKIALGGRYEELCSLAEGICGVVGKKKKGYASARMVFSPLAKMSVAREIEARTGEIKQRSAVMMLHDFNRIVSRHLRGEPVPFIYEKIGERYRHYFIDEFQDTSALQWANLRELVYNQLAQDGSALVVGDAKQAIYRWRGGDTEQFVDLYETGGGLAPEQFRVSNLDTNYRSGGTVVDFTNEFFSLAAPLAGSEAFSKVYEAGNRQKGAAGPGGFVSICQVAGETVQKRLEPTLKATLEEIRRVVGSDGFSWGEVAVLYRSNREGTALAEYLSQNGVPVVSSESLLLASSQAVRVAAAVLRTMAYPHDLQARATVLEFLQGEGAFGGDDPDRCKAGGVAGGVQEFFSILGRATGGGFSPEQARSLPLYESVEYVGRALGLWGRGQDAYLMAFLDLAAGFVKDRTGSATAFLEYWDKKKNSAGIPGSDAGDAVRLMTIHKSKGLEFPVVIVPFAWWRMSENEEVWAEMPQDGPLEGLPVACVPLAGAKKYGMDEVYEPYRARIRMDNLNLLYVALTRPRRQLHVITCLDAKGQTVAEFFENFLGNTDLRNEDDPEGFYLYSAGKRGKGSGGKVSEAEEAFLLDGISCGQWRDRLRVNLDWKKVWAVPVQAAVERGNVLHQVLSMVETADGIDAAVTRAAGAGLFPESEMMAVRSAVRAVTEHPKMREYFLPEWKALPEREIMEAGGKVLRPDRVCVNGSRAVVVDYKTGVARPEHRAQVENYAALLRAMGYEVEKSLLVYLGSEGAEVLEC